MNYMNITLKIMKYIAIAGLILGITTTTIAYKVHKETTRLLLITLL